MSKKKAIKLVAASAIAASSFAAVAPSQADAATSVSTLVSNASKTSKAAYDKYFKATSYVKTGTMDSYIKKAKDAVAKAEKAVKSYKGSKKKAYEASIKTAKGYITKAEGYRKGAHEAYYTNKDLVKALDAVKVDLEAKDVAKVEAGLTALKADITAAKKAIKDTIYGANAEKIVYAKYTTPVETAVKEAEAKLAELKAVPKVESVSAIGAKTLQVKFTKEVSVTAADFSVKKGSMKANVAKVTISEDGKTAVVELTSKFTKGEYTVTVAQGTAAALTGTVSVEDEKVEKVEILSTSAPLFDSSNSDVDSDKDDVTVGYKVSNQYGEDITKVTTVTPSASTGTVTASNGVIEVVGNFKEGDKTTVTLVHPESAKSVTATLTASAEAKVAEVTVKGLYNADGKSLNEDTDLSKDSFYVEVEAKDQYGTAITKASQLNSDVIINETNPNVADLAGTFTELTVNGTKKLVLAVNNPAGGSKAVAGETLVTLISKFTGKNVQYSVKVDEATRADVVALSQPNLVVVGEDALVPVEVLDKSGKAITDIKVLNHATKGVKVTLGSTQVSFVEKDGAPYVKLPAASLTAEGPVALVAVSSTTKVQTLTLSVKAAAKPVIVTGLSSDFGSTFKSGQTKNISVADLVVEDQYGRVMSETKLNTWLGLAPANKIVVTEDEGSSVFTISNSAGDNDIAASGEEVAVVAGSAKGTENITITLHDANGAIASSAKETSLRVTDGSEYKSYEVSAVGTVYDESAASKTDDVAYDKAVKVYGVLNDGSKVRLTNGTDYAVSSTNSTLNTDVNSDGVIDVTSSYGTAYGDETSIKLPLQVTINATGERFNQEITVSKSAPKVAAIDVVAEGDGDDFIDGLAVDALEKFNYDAATDGAFNFTQLDANADVVVTDQYGVSVILDGSDAFPDTTAITNTLTLSKVNGELTFVNNGRTNATVTEIANGSAFNVVLSVGNVDSAAVKVTATSAFSSSVANTTAVSTDKTALTLSAATPAGATSTIALPATGSNGTTITWAKSGTAIAGADGTVTTSVTTDTRPGAGGTALTATLTATITKGAASQTKVFTVTVPETGNITIVPAP